MARKSLKMQQAAEQVSQTSESSPEELENKAKGSPTKKSRLIGLLSQEDGATLAAISSALGWLRHTTRAAITGLRKGGLRVETGASDEGTRYRLVPQPTVLSPSTATAKGV
jgi:biotin operon repressor